MDRDRCSYEEVAIIKKGVDKKRYDRIASLYDLLESPMELLSYSRWREEVFEKVPEKGRILEVGVGTGKNLSHYNEGHEVFAVDISAKMLKKAERRADRVKASVHLVQMDVESLGFPDEVFDAAISTYVFCSVENPSRGLREIRRVLRRDRTVIFLEHMRSENEFLGKAMDFMNPLVVNTYGANINRRTVDNIMMAGFEVIEEKYLLSSIFRIIMARPTFSNNDR